jgi:hypothetical protein
MTNETKTYLILAVCGVFSLAAWIGLVVVPAWSSYQRGWERVAALFLSLYVLLAGIFLGAAIGGAIVYLWIT